jgi:hypothetical protein
VIDINVWASLCVPAGNPDVWPRPSSGLGGLRKMVRGLAQPFAAHLLGKRGGISVVPLTGGCGNRPFGVMGFNRRKLEDQRREAAELWMREIMYRLLIVGILIISTMPLSAQGQQPDAAKLMADARNLVSIISSDKAKTQTYCQLGIVGEQMNQALQAKDKKKFEELVQKLAELEKNLGPEYRGLFESLGKVNLTPKDGQEIVSMFDTLDNSCRH